MSGVIYENTIGCRVDVAINYGQVILNSLNNK